VSLRTRLLLAAGTVALVALVIADIVTYQELHSFLFTQVDQSLQATSSPLGFSIFGGGPPVPGGGPVGNGVGRGGPEATADTSCSLPQGVLHQLTPGAFIEVRVNDTVVDRCRVPEIASAPTATPDLPTHIGGLVSNSSAPGTSVRYFTVPATHPGSSFRVRAATTAGGPELVVALPLDDTMSTLGRLVDIELAVTGAALLVALLCGWWLVRIGLRPLRAVEATAGSIAAGELDQRVPGAAANTEVGRLARALNIMLGRIESAFAERDATESELRESEGRMRRFVADASHELRTPLAAISAYAELFERGASSRADDLERVMTGIGTEAGRMGHLVEDLLLLARLDEGRPLERRPVELVALAGEAAQTARTVAPEWPVTLTARRPVEVTGDGPRLRQVLDNLLANVRAHTPAGTTTELGVTSDGDAALITCADNGPGLDAASTDRVFERFFRADPSRSRQHGGAGLGLSIVDSIVRAHGGTVTALPRAGGGVTFLVRLPLDGAAETAPSEEPAPPVRSVLE
jgi:two-component system, OmpR family, sensor kinase